MILTSKDKGKGQVRKNVSFLLGRLVYIVGTCILLFIGVLILSGDKKPEDTFIVRMHQQPTSVDLPTSPKLKTRLPESEHLRDSDRLHTVHPPGKVVSPDAVSEVLSSKQEVSPEKITSGDTPISALNQMDTENTENTELTGVSNSV